MVNGRLAAAPAANAIIPFVFGMTERGGRTWATTIPDVKLETIRAK
jgi:hypothetical protein